MNLGTLEVSAIRGKFSQRQPVRGISMAFDKTRRIVIWAKSDKANASKYAGHSWFGLGERGLPVQSATQACGFKFVFGQMASWQEEKIINTANVIIFI